MQLHKVNIRSHNMIHRSYHNPADSAPHSFAECMKRLGETFVVRDVMVPLSLIDYVAPGEEDRARQLVEEKRYSVVPVSKDGQTFASVFCASHPPDCDRIIIAPQGTSVVDHIPDSTPLAEALFLFETREWYLALRGNRVSGLVTYWAFNSREFRVQLYTGLSRIEELSRDALAKDGCGVSDESGLNLTPEATEKVRKQFKSARQKLGGNRFVDELQFHQVNDALRKHSSWRSFLNGRLGRSLTENQYKGRYEFTSLRDAVMHGRVLFPTYVDFGKFIATIDNMGHFIDYLHAYSAPDATGNAVV
jgi:hypothetical protein